IQCDHVNSTRDVLTHQPEWSLLLARVGGLCLTDLLLRHMVLLPLPANGSFLQLSGPPLPSLLSRKEVVARYQAATRLKRRRAGRKEGKGERKEGGEGEEEIEEEDKEAKEEDNQKNEGKEEENAVEEEKGVKQREERKGVIFAAEASEEKVDRKSDGEKGREEGNEDEGSRKKRKCTTEDEEERLNSSRSRREGDEWEEAEVAMEEGGEEEEEEEEEEKKNVLKKINEKERGRKEGKEDKDRQQQQQQQQQQQEEEEEVVISLGRILYSCEFKGRGVGLHPHSLLSRVLSSGRKERAKERGEEGGRGGRSDTSLLSRQAGRLVESIFCPLPPPPPPSFLLPYPPPSAPPTQAKQKIKRGPHPNRAPSRLPSLPPATRRRIRQVVPLLVDLLERYQGLNVGRMLGRFCPYEKTKIRKRGREGGREGGDKEEEEGAGYRSQAEAAGGWGDEEEDEEAEEKSRRQVKNRREGGGRKRARERGKEEAKEEDEDFLGHILEHATLPSKVAAFLRTFLRHVLPPSLLGSRHNTQIFIQAAVRTCVEEAHSRTLISPSAFLSGGGLRVKEVGWAAAASSPPSSSVPSPSDLALRQDLVLSLLRFLLADLVLPLLKGCFYVTEADGTGLALHFFRKPVWQRVQSTPLEVLFPGQYEALDLFPPSAGAGRGEVGKEGGGERAAVPWRLGVSAIRLMPKKKGGLRIIADHAKAPVAVQDLLRSKEGGREGGGEGGLQRGGKRYSLLPVNRALANVHQ
ncbi:hypothetical protein VYU27_010139, partial [Nannochloropsis oceanica]